MMSATNTETIDRNERRIISSKSVYSIDESTGSPVSPDRLYDTRSVQDLTAAIQRVKETPAKTNEESTELAAVLRKITSRLCSLNTMEATECILKQIGIEFTLTPAIAKYGLTAIANCTSTEEARMKLMKNGAGEYIVHMLKKYGEEHFSVAQYGIIAITNLTSSAEIRHLLGALNACPVIVQMLRQHAFVMVDNGKGVMEAPVAVYGLYAIGKLSLNHDQNRQRFGTCGGCEEVVTVLERLGADNHTVTDYGMYALAHLAYFNLENKKRLSNVETYKVIMSLLQRHGRWHISIASFGLTAVSNLIHTEASKDKFGALGMCELVEEMGQHYSMQPEALANNVVFTIGKLSHKHAENSRLLASGCIPLIVRSLRAFGMDKATQAGNGLFALSALIQYNNQVALEKVTSVEVVELVVTLLSLHGVEDASIAIYGVNILDGVVMYAHERGDTVSSFVLKTLVGLKIGTLVMHLVRAYSYNDLNCNVEIIARSVNLVRLLLQHGGSGSTLTEFKAQLNAAQAAKLLRGAVLNNILIMERHANQQADELIAILQH